MNEIEVLKLLDKLSENNYEVTYKMTKQKNLINEINYQVLSSKQISTG